MLRQKKKSYQNTWNQSKNISRFSFILYVFDYFCVSRFWTGASEHSQNQEKVFLGKKKFLKKKLLWIWFVSDRLQAVRSFGGNNFWSWCLEHVRNRKNSFVEKMDFLYSGNLQAVYFYDVGHFFYWILRMFGKENSFLEKISWLFSKNSQDLNLFLGVFLPICSFLHLCCW